MDSVTAALHAATVANWLAFAAILSALLLPLGGIWILSRVTKGRRFWQAAAMWVSGCFSLLFYAFVALVFGVCWGGERGEPSRYRLAKAYGTPIVAALDKFHQANNTYPPTLGALAPRYLTVRELRAAEDSPLGSGFQYRADSGRYKLSIDFAEPGPRNTCSIQPGSRWDCYGHPW